MGKKTVNYVQEAQRVPSSINPRRNTPRHMVIRMMKIKDIKFESNKGKMTNNIQENSNQLIT